MAKLCPKGKAAAKRKFKVYPSAYANMYASAVCSGKVTPGGKKGRTKKAEGGSLSDRLDDSSKMKKKSDILLQKRINLKPSQKRKFKTTPIGKRPLKPMARKPLTKRKPTRIQENRSMYGRGGGVCIRGMNKDAYGKNS
jgi:hypothetical protein